jgi:hypothetical protein
MTENEKLRALLKEAREALVRAENRMASPPHQVPDAIARIDAALAEPTGPERSPLCPGEGTWSVFAQKVVAERDEVRARCEKLRELADMAAAEQGLAQRRMMEAQKERDEARAALANAYRRGAEAMREKAAIRAENYFVSAHYASALSTQIRHLTIPEDKP